MCAKCRVGVKGCEPDMKTLTLVVGIKREPAEVAVEDLRGYQLLGILGSGTSATVYECEGGGGGPTLAMKVQKYDRGAEEEAQVARTFSDMGIGPTYIDAWHTEQLHFLVTDKWDGSMLHFQLDTLPPALLYKLETCVKRMHELNLVHADLLPKNVLVKMHNGAPVDVTLCDFGLVRESHVWQGDSDDDVLRMLQYYRHRGNPSCNYMRRNAIDIEKLAEYPFHADLAFLDYMKRKNDKNVRRPAHAQPQRRSKRLQRENVVDCSRDEQGGSTKRAQLRVPKPKGW